MSTENINAIQVDKSEQPEKKSKPKRSPWLADDTRTSILHRLEKLGVDTKDLSDEDIVKKMMEIEMDASERLAKSEASKALVPLNLYAQTEGCRIKNKELIERLYNLGVPAIWLPEFTDEDIKLDKREIWKKVQKSPIRQIYEVKEIFQDRSARVVR